MSKTIIITGAGGNLGKAVTEKILAEGYRVVATVTSEEAKKTLPASDKLQAEILNLTNETETEKFVRNTVVQHQKIDAALLLVGGFATGNIAATKGDDIKKQITLNFNTAYNIARPLFQHMLANGEGRLVFIGSRPVLEARAGKEMLAYGLSKSLLFKLADYLNEEAKGTNVTATVIVPSTLDTPINRKAMPTANPDNWVKPDALADILAFVISEKASPLRETVLKVYNNA